LSTIQLVDKVIVDSFCALSPLYAAGPVKMSLGVCALEPATHGKVLLKTTAGDVDIELWPKEAPKACRNFVQLCLEGYYDNTIFHRIVKDFIVQGGDPTGTGFGACDPLKYGFYLLYEEEFIVISSSSSLGAHRNRRRVGVWRAISG